MDILLRKVPGGLLYPVDDEGMEYLQKFKTNDILRCVITRPRNVDFHRKLFALVKIGYDAWEPLDTEYKGHPVEKNFEQFRNDITVAAGYYTSSVNLSGGVSLKAKSWSFGSMKQDEFEKMYSAISTVLLEGVLLHYNQDDLDNVVREMLKF